MFEADDIKNGKIKKIIAALLAEMDILENWTGSGYHVAHKHYNLNVDREDINKPLNMSIPRRFRKRVRIKIKAIHRHVELKNLDFILGVLTHKYPIQEPISDKSERVDWCKENEIEYKIYRYHGTRWIYIKEGDGAMAYKLRWSE